MFPKASSFTHQHRDIFEISKPLCKTQYSIKCVPISIPSYYVPQNEMQLFCMALGSLTLSLLSAGHLEPIYSWSNPKFLFKPSLMAAQHLLVAWQRCLPPAC